ncbi:MAG TPA: polysaccharide pyruvyl transferase CsaB [Candidatus Eremiobacteraeota bacterium]|nr:polysaccharide pyruvyl transferase CsaB [Candidatus Eremiobacteraeota bacterium]
MAKNDVLISGYYGFGNAGDEAILASILDALLKIMPELKIMVLSVNPSLTEKEHKISAVHRYRWEMLHSLWESRLFISGGGGLLQDSTSIKTPLYYLGMVLLAKLMGKKVMFYAQGIGPLRTFWGRLLTSYIANRVNFITVRDEKSYNLLRELGVKRPPVEITTDPVFAMEPAVESDVLEVFKKEEIPLDGKWLGISVRDWKTNVDYAGIISQVIDNLCDKFSLRVLFIPMHYPNDLEISMGIKDMMKNPSYMLSGKYPPKVIMGILGKMDTVFAMRLHTVIMSSVLGVPSIPVAYDPKIENISGQLGLKFLSLEDITFENLLKLSSDVCQEREKISSNLLVRSRELGDIALGNAFFVRNLLYNRNLH